MASPSAEWIQGKVLGAWLRWLPVLLVPFSMVFVDTWLNTERINKDYQVNELKMRCSELQEELDALLNREAELVTMKRIESQAPGIGLGPPKPGQIRTIYYRPSQGPPTDGAGTTAVGCLSEDRPVRGRQSCATNEDTGQGAPIGNGVASWDSNEPSNRTGTISLMARLRQAIAAAWALYSSPS